MPHSTFPTSSLHAIRQPDGGDDAAASPVAHQWLMLVRRRWALALAVWVVAMSVAGAILYVLPRQFQSTARFLVKNARQDLVVGPNDSSSSVYRDEVSEEVMNTELELLRSRDILARVVGELELDKGYLQQGKPAAESRELAVRDLGASIVAEAIRKTNLIQVSYMSPMPALSAAVLQHLSDAYLAEHLTMHSSPGTYELFKEQGDQANRELQSAQESLASLARSANLVVPDEQQKDTMRSITDAEAQYTALQAEIHDMTARIQAAERKMAEVPRRVQTEIKNVPNQAAAERLSTIIVEMKNRRTELLTKFNEDDRLVQQVDQQIRDTEAALREARALSVDEQATNANPAWIELESESLKAQLQLAGLTGKANELRDSLRRYQARALELREATPKYEAVARRIAREEANYQLYVKKQEEARIVEALDRQRISNVVVAQAPFVSSIPAKPNVRLGLLIGASIATTLSLCAVLAAEHLAALLAFRKQEAVEIETGSTPAAAAL